MFKQRNRVTTTKQLSIIIVDSDKILWNFTLLVFSSERVNLMDKTCSDQYRPYQRQIKRAVRQFYCFLIVLLSVGFAKH